MDHICVKTRAGGRAGEGGGMGVGVGVCVGEGGVGPHREGPTYNIQNGHGW